MPKAAAPTAEVLARNQQLYEHLKQIRASKTVSLKSTPMLRPEIVGLDGTPQEFHLRYYQVIGVYHLLAVKRMVLGDGTGLGKTVELVSFLAYLWAKEPENKVIIVTPKSALGQWESEILRFTTGVKPFVVRGSLAERKEIYQNFAHHVGPEKAVLIINYHVLIRDWNFGSNRPLLPNGQPDPKANPTPGLLDGITQSLKSSVVTFDECQAFKNLNTKTAQVCSFLSQRAGRCYGLTATLLKNRLEEGFSIYKVIVPGLFTTKTRFLEEFCFTKLQSVPGGRKIPIITGYKNLQTFRDRIDPYFLGRPKHVVSDELPKLITKEVTVEMTPAENAKYEEALNGVLELGDGEVRDYEEHKAFVALTYCQQVVNSLSLLRYGEGDSIDLDMFREEQAEVGTGSKEQALMDLLEEEFDEEKVIVYTRFSSLVPRLQELCNKAGIRNVAITGDVKDKDREKAKNAFQDLNSGVRVIFITSAGSEAINLQAASAMIFYDAPWSWGDYVQLLGRPIRIGSPHQHVVAVHLVAKRPGRKKKTIDHYTLDLLAKKKDLVDKVLGESAVGALEFDKGGSFVVELAKNLADSRADDVV